MESRVEIETGYEIGNGLFAVRSGVEAKDPASILIHISPLDSILRPVEVRGGTSVELFESNVALPSEVTALFTEYEIVMAPPEAEQYVKIGWISERLPVMFADTPTPPESHSRISWKRINERYFDSCRKSAAKVVAAAAAYGGDAIINIRIMSYITGYTFGKATRSPPYLCGDVICLKR